MDPKTITIKTAVEFAADLKNELGAIEDHHMVYIEQDAKDFLIEFLALSHPSGNRINVGEADLTIAAKPANCDRAGTSQACYYIQCRADARFQPVWFADCRKALRSQRLREMEENQAPIAA